MASNPYVNKVVYGNSTLIDLSTDTATQADVAQGKYFHLPTGERVQGTASGGGGTGSITQDQDGYLVLSPDGGGGGGGGLEYEEGTWTPTTDIALPTISFKNTHTTKPTFVMIADATGTDYTTQNTNYGWIYGSFHAYTGNGVPSNISTSPRYALASYTYVGTGNPTQLVAGITSLTGSASGSQDGFWVSTTGFSPNTNSTSRYWRSDRTYKWIAVWPPTT